MTFKVLKYTDRTQNVTKISSSSTHSRKVPIFRIFLWLKKESGPEPSGLLGTYLESGAVIGVVFLGELESNAEELKVELKEEFATKEEMLSVVQSFQKLKASSVSGFTVFKM